MTVRSEEKGTRPSTTEGGNSSTNLVFSRVSLISGTGAALLDAPLRDRGLLDADELTKGEERL
jgi:hypothetical protein